MSSSRRDFLKIMGISAAAGVPAGPSFVASASVAAAENSAGAIRLDNNEDAYGPSRKVVEAIRLAASEANRFPGARAYELAERIAKSHNVTPDQVVLGAGSTEVLRMASCAFLGPGKQLVQASPTYPAHGILCARQRRGCDFRSAQPPVWPRSGRHAGACRGRARAWSIFVIRTIPQARSPRGRDFRILSPGCLPPVTS